MTEKLTDKQLDALFAQVNEAARRTEMPGADIVDAAFDGDAWIWSWSLDDARRFRGYTVQALVYMRPDKDEEEWVKFETFVRAWQTGDPSVTDAVEIGTHTVTLEELSSKRSLTALLEQLQGDLDRAKKRASRVVERLPNREKLERELESRLRKDGLLKR